MNCETKRPAGAVGGTCKYTKAPSTKKTLRNSLPIDMLLSAVSFLVVAQSSSEVPEGLMNNPVYVLVILRSVNTNLSPVFTKPA